METTLAFTGQAALDYRFRAARLRPSPTCSTTAEIRGEGGAVAIPLTQPLTPGGKIAASTELPPELLRFADSVMPGGGALNSSLEARRIDSGARLRYLDASAAAEPVRAANDKTILKSPPAAADRIPVDFETKMAWLAEAHAVLANSIKDAVVMDRLASAAAQGKIRLYTAITPSLPAEYTVETVLPASTAAICGADEAAVALGLRRGAGLSGAVRVIEAMLSFAPFALSFVTAGKDGVLAADPSLRSIFHVRLRRRILKRVQDWIAHDPSATCGCGDGFAAGAMMELEIGRSLLIGAPVERRRAVRAALAGSAAAIDHLGYPERITESDFAIREYPLTGRPSGSRAVA